MFERHLLNLTAPDGASWNWAWQKCRRLFLRKHGRICACCGYKKKIQVHHILPRHIRPDLALDHSNLIVMCRDCHFHIGHLNSYFTYNEAIEIVCWYVRELSIKKKNKR